MTDTRLLVVDDEDDLRSMIEAALRHHGFEVTTAATGCEALAAAASTRPDLVVLDIGLPDLDGFDVCRRFRAEGIRAPVLFLTVRDTAEAEVRGLTVSGDDHLVKPFGLEDLVARIGALLRRSGVEHGGSVLRCADLELDDDTHRVTRGGAEVALSPTEYHLLRHLLVNQGRVLTKSQILDHVWHYDFCGDGNVVEIYIGYLRRKLDPAEPRLIQTVRGEGYCLRAPREG